MKKFMKFIAIVFCIISLFSVLAAPTSASSQSEGYGDEAEDSGDYMFWNGSEMEKSQSTSTEEVMWAQKMLNHCIEFEGLNTTWLTVDGNFGPACKAATVAFQRAADLTPDGHFGPDTIQAIKKVVNDNTENSLVNRTDAQDTASGDTPLIASSRWEDASNDRDNTDTGEYTREDYIRDVERVIVSLARSIYNLIRAIPYDEIAAAFQDLLSEISSSTQNG